MWDRGESLGGQIPQFMHGECGQGDGEGGQTLTPHARNQIMQGHGMEDDQAKMQTQNVKKSKPVEGGREREKERTHTTNTRDDMGDKYYKTDTKRIEEPREIVSPQVPAYTHK